MSHLQKALYVWTQAGHSQAEFAKKTGIEQSICSRVFAGSRGLTISQRTAIFRTFTGSETQQGLHFIKADLEDQIPPDARKALRLVIDIPARLTEQSKKPANKVEEARKNFADALQNREPEMLAMALALQTWRDH